jgi:hypothetical protein
MDDESPAENGATSKKKRKYYKWQCQQAGCIKQAQTGRNSMCKKHYSEYLLRQRNNNELNQSKNDAQSNNNEVSQSSNDVQQGAMVLAALSDHVSNDREINSNVCINETTHVPVVSDQQNINSIVKTGATDEPPVDQEYKAEQQETTTDERGVREDNTTQRAVATDEPPVVGEHGAEQRAARSVDKNESAHVSTIPSVTTGLLNRIRLIKEENENLQNRISNLEDLNRIRLIEEENENLKDRISSLEETVKHLMRPSALSLGIITGTQHGSDILCSETDDVVGTFTYFESFGSTRTRTAGTHANMLTRCNSHRNAGLVNSGNL